MRDRERFLFLSFQIDANRINARQGLDSMNQLESWRDQGLIEIIISETAQREAASGDTLRAAKAYGLIYSMTEISTQDEERFRGLIEQTLFPEGANSQNQKNDVDVVFNASKYGRVLVTNDGGSKSQPGGILGNRARLAALGIKVMSDSEAVQYVRNEILQRDINLRNLCAVTGETLPDWVGKDAV